VHDFYCQQDNRRMMNTYMHAARCYRALADANVSVFGMLILSGIF
jgi:hypothetical protein